MFLSFVLIAMLGIVAYLVLRSKNSSVPEQPSVDPASLGTGPRPDDTVPLRRDRLDL